MLYKPLGQTGLAVSQLGFGASPLGDEFGRVDAAECTRAVHRAMDCGVNFFDVAPYYGRGLAERRLGEALLGRRQDVVLATKCGRYDLDLFDFSRRRTVESIEESLVRLRTDYVDILHVHDIEYGDRRQIVDETIPALREIQSSGKARFIGITGLALRMLREVAAEAPVDCILSYCRYTLLNRDMDSELTPFIRRHDIGLVNASPLHMRLLSAAGPPPWHPAPPATKAAAREIVASCARTGVRVEDVAIRFAVSHPYVSTTVVGISARAEMDANLRALDSEIDPGLLSTIEQIACPVKSVVWITGRPENH